MLNPSTADGDKDDLTTIRCMNFAKKWGYGGLMIGNIYPLRAKRPRDLKKWLNNHLWKTFDNLQGDKEYKVLFKNINHVADMAQQANIIVCAWGCNYKKGIPGWVKGLGKLHYLELCDDGVTPKHPLGNLSKDLLPKQYKLNTIIDG